jgi:hypothetical protein
LRMAVAAAAAAAVDCSGGCDDCGGGGGGRVEFDGLKIRKSGGRKIWKRVKS